MYSKKILNPYVRIIVLLIWVGAVVIAINGITQLKTKFSMSLFIPTGSPTQKYYDMDLASFRTGFDIATMVENPELDYSTEEN